MNKIKSLVVIRKIIKYLTEPLKLKIFNYNKKWQKKLDIKLNDYIAYVLLKEEENFMENVMKTEKVIKKENKEKIKKILIRYFKYKIKYLNKNLFNNIK